MLRSFRCSLVNIFWGSVVFRILPERASRNATRVFPRRFECFSVVRVTASRNYGKTDVQEIALIIRQNAFLLIGGFESFMSLPITHYRDFSNEFPFPPCSRCMYGKQLNQQNICTERTCIISLIFCFIYHLRLGCRLFRGRQLLKGALRINRLGEKRNEAICRPSIGRKVVVVTGKAGLTIEASLWGPARGPTPSLMYTFND
jgi:hypothetical protein